MEILLTLNLAQHLSRDWFVADQADDLTWLTRTDLNFGSPNSLLSEFSSWADQWNFACLQGYQANDAYYDSLHGRSRAIIRDLHYPFDHRYQYWAIAEKFISHLIAFGDDREAELEAERLFTSCEEFVTGPWSPLFRKAFSALRLQAASYRNISFSKTMAGLADAKKYLDEWPEDAYFHKDDRFMESDFRLSDAFEGYHFDLLHEELRARIREILRKDYANRTQRNSRSRNLADELGFLDDALPLLQVSQLFITQCKRLPSDHQRAMIRDTLLRAKLFTGRQPDEIIESARVEAEREQLPETQRHAFLQTMALAQHFSGEHDEAFATLNLSKERASSRELMRAVSNSLDLITWLGLSG